MNAYTFTTQAQASAALALVEDEIRSVAAEKGFTVTPDGKVIGKNAATGEDVPTAVTERWSEVIQFADGTWGFPSLRQGFPTTWERIEAVASLQPPTEVSLAV